MNNDTQTPSTPNITTHTDIYKSASAEKSAQANLLLKGMRPALRTDTNPRDDSDVESKFESAELKISCLAPAPTISQ